MLKWFKTKIAGKENYAIINSSWCTNRSGIVLSFAIPIEVMSLEEIKEFGKQFISAIEESYGDFLDEYFYAKTESPVIAATADEQIIMLWAFQANDNKNVREIMKEYQIDEIKYN